MEYEKFSAKTVSEAVNQAMEELHATEEELEYEVLDKGSSGLFGIGSKPAVIQAKKKFTLEGAAKDFLSQVFKLMNMEVDMDIVYNEEDKAIEVDLKGDDMGILIGKRGQTLDSLQYLTGLVINKYTDEYIRVKLDIENYRERRKETLENLAKNIAYKVKRTKRPVSLEPMNPYERRIIHSTLQADKYVVTRSEGDEPFRHVVISLKRERREYNNREGNRGGYRRSYNNSYRSSYNRDSREYGTKEYGNRDNREYGTKEYGNRDNREYGTREYGNRDNREYGTKEYGNRENREYGTKDYNSRDNKNYGSRDYNREGGREYSRDYNNRGGRYQRNYGYNRNQSQNYDGEKSEKSENQQVSEGSEE